MRARSWRWSRAAGSPSTPSCSPPIPRARVVVTGSTGYDHFDLEQLRAAGVAAYCTPDYCSREVADFALACALAGLRGVVGLDRAMQAGVWEERAAGTTRRVRGSVLGVIGLGKIGSLVARDAAALGMRVLAATRSRAYEAFAAAGAERSELGALLGASDVVTLHAPHVRGAKPLLGRKEFPLFKQGSILVNAARAELVDIEELIHGLAARAARLGVHGRVGSGAAAARRLPPRRPESRAHAARRLVLARCRRGAVRAHRRDGRWPRCAASPRGG